MDYCFTIMYKHNAISLINENTKSHWMLCDGHLCTKHWAKRSSKGNFDSEQMHNKIYTPEIAMRFLKKFYFYFLVLFSAADSSSV